MRNTTVGILSTIGISLVALFILSGCSYIREQSYKRLDKKHAEQIDKALTLMQDSSQLLQAGSFEESIDKAKMVQGSLRNAIETGRDALKLANEIYDEWTAAFLRQRVELEEIYFSMAELIEDTASALKEHDMNAASVHLGKIDELKTKTGELISRTEALQKLRDGTNKLLVPKFALPNK